MKVKIELAAGETIDQADEMLEKAISAKKECSGEERYHDDYLNEFEIYILSEHKKLTEQIAKEILDEMVFHAHS